MHVEKMYVKASWNPSRYERKVKGWKKYHDDLQQLSKRRSLWPRDQGKKTFLPPAPHTLSKKEKETHCVVLFTLKVLDGYSSNRRIHISIDEFKFHGMKTHDFHVLMQQFLPVAMHHVLPKVMQNTICMFYFIYR